MDFRSGRTTSSVASTPPQRDESAHDEASHSSPLPPILSPQVTAAEAIRMWEVQEVLSDTEMLAVADTLLSMRAQHSATAPSQQPISLPPHKKTSMHRFQF